MVLKLARSLRQYLTSTGVFSVLGLLGHGDDRKSGTVATGLDADGRRVSFVARDDAAMSLVGTGDLGAGKFLLVEITDFVYGIVALEVGGDRVETAECHRRCTFFSQVGSGVDLHTEILCGLLGIGGGLHIAEGGFDFHIVALLRDVGALDSAMDDDAACDHAKDSDQDDDANDDQDDLEGAAAAFGRRRAGSDGLGSGSRNATHRSAAIVAEFCALVEGCTAGITECHGSPRASA